MPYSGGAHQDHQEHLPSAQGGLRRRLGNSLKSNDLQGSIKAPKREKRSPNCADDALGAYKSIISGSGQAGPRRHAQHIEDLSFGIQAVREGAADGAWSLKEPGRR